MINYQLDLKAPSEPVEKYWNFCVGSCHAATALREDYRQMLKQCHRDLGFRYLRFHGLFNDDMSVLSKPMFSDELKLSFTNIDNIFDFLLSIGMKPFIELSFMPEVLASSHTTIFHYKGKTSPPSDYGKWEWFIESFINHIIERYGRSEVRQWFFEVWNEPNLGGEGSPFGFWSGSKEEYFKLYKSTASAVKRCDKSLRVGGPATSNNAWIPEFVEFCKNNDAPLDFVSTHQYPTDVVLGYGVEDSANFVNPFPIDNQERVAEIINIAKDGGEEFEKFKEEYSVFQSKLWEHVDRGVLTDMVKRAVKEASPYPLYYTEWGSLAGLESDSSFGASFIAKTIMDNIGLVKGYSFWTFSDIVEEDAQNSSEFHGGFGLMTQHGIPKAPYRAFELLNRLDGELIKTQIKREDTVDIYPFRSDNINGITLLAVNHNSLLHEIKKEDIQLSFSSEKKVISAEITVIDDHNSNACELWKKSENKEYLSNGDISVLKGMSQLKRKPLDFQCQGENYSFDFSLEPMATALINIYFE